MKKALIAGAASVAMAAMPVMGVFAEDLRTVEDNLEIKIETVCSFGHEDTTAGIDVEGVSRAAGTGNYAGTWADNTLSATFVTGQTNEAIGTTTLGVYCNNEKGYTIATTNAGSLTSSTTADVIAVGGTMDGAASNWSYKVAAGTATSQRGEVKGAHAQWATSANVNEVIAGSKTSAPKTTDNDGDFYTITYGVSVGESQSAGTYTGKITYTLAMLNS